MKPLYENQTHVGNLIKNYFSNLLKTTMFESFIYIYIYRIYIYSMENFMCSVTA